ncbi:hypothetical protein [Streptomyces cadmiisoli]|uniref:hypothetical protein n=1 Tax=Streptomyces cadmiisoli TaxID=2184053 RepID=UPI003654C3AC
MTDNELQMLCIGITIGVYLMIVLDIVQGFAEDRRDRKVARATQRRSAGDDFHRSLRLYRLQQRLEARQ